MRVLVAADNVLARAGLSSLLAGGEDLTIVGQISGGETLSADIELYRPELLVYDLGWNPAGIFEWLAGLRQMPVLALLPDHEWVVESVRALRETGSPYGVLLRDTHPDRLLAALYAVAGGLLVIDPALAGALFPPITALPLPSDDDQPEALTPRELEVLQLLAQGMANKGIAAQLSISEHTVKFHVNAVMTKLNAQSRTEAVVRATRLGWVIL